MSDNDWWARRLGRAQAQPQQPTGFQQNYPALVRQLQTPQFHAPQFQASPSIRVTPENLFEATKHWQGGEAHRRETRTCPRCGGGHFFSRTSEVSRGPSPAPLCYDCGFTGLFQQGDPSNYSV
jgi:ribosomal protein S27AE